jgi:uncharacterized protein
MNAWRSVPCFIPMMAICAGSCAIALADDGKLKEKSAAKPSTSEQHWEGSLTIRPGVLARMVVHVKTDAQGATVATLDSPDEGLEGLKLDPFTLDKNRLTFELKISAAKYEGKLNPDGTEAVGIWSQRGHNLPLTFKQTKTPTPVPKNVGPE